MLSYLNLTYETMIKITNKIIKSADNYPLPYLQVEPDNNTSKKSIGVLFKLKLKKDLVVFCFKFIKNFYHR